MTYVCLCGVDKEKLAGHILMQRIFPSALPGYQLRDGSLSAGNTLSEVRPTLTAKHAGERVDSA